MAEPDLTGAILKRLDAEFSDEDVERLLAAPPITRQAVASSTTEAMADSLFKSFTKLMDKKIEAARKDFLVHWHATHPEVVEGLKEQATLLKEQAMSLERLQRRVEIIEHKGRLESYDRQARPPR